MTKPALKVLVATTTWWPSAAHIAIASNRAGARIYSLAPIGNPLRKLKFIEARHTYSAWRPGRSLIKAMTTFGPDLIIPLDDRTVEHIYNVYAKLSGGISHREKFICALIERSLGAPSGFHLSRTRHAFLEEMRASGVLVPPGAEVSTIRDVEAWCAARPPPWIFKAEGSWGGSGVVVAATVAGARAAHLELSSPLPIHKAVRFRLVDRDPFALARFFDGKKRRVMAQAHIRGREATCMAAAWKGRLLASINAEVLSRQGRVGASTVLRLIENPRMDEAAAATAARLGLSGFFGLDFIIEESSGRHFLIEMNPRATQLGHIRTQGADLVTRLYEAAGAAIPPRQPLPDHGPLIAFFPQALRFLEHDMALGELPIDVPWDEPALVEELLRLPWTKRGVVARLEAAFRRNEAFGSAIEPRRVKEILGELQRRTARRQVERTSTATRREEARALE